MRRLSEYAIGSQFLLYFPPRVTMAQVRMSKMRSKAEQTWSQFPTIGKARGPGGSLSFGSRSFTMISPTKTATQSPCNIVSKLSPGILKWLRLAIKSSIFHQFSFPTLFRDFLKTLPETATWCQSPALWKYKIHIIAIFAMTIVCELWNGMLKLGEAVNFIEENHHQWANASTPA